MLKKKKTTCKSDKFVDQAYWNEFANGDETDFFGRGVEGNAEEKSIVLLLDGTEFASVQE